MRRLEGSETRTCKLGKTNGFGSLSTLGISDILSVESSSSLPLFGEPSFNTDEDEHLAFDRDINRVLLAGRS